MLDFEHHKNQRVRKAFEIAKIAHANQKDKSGADYINHPMAVASNVGEDISAIIVAILHDVIEDHGDKYNLNILKREVHLTVIEAAALRLLTHDKNISYFDYIKAIKSNELAKKIKLADLKHNSDLNRLKLITAKDQKRLNKYKKAIEILNNTVNINAD